MCRLIYETLLNKHRKSVIENLSCEKIVKSIIIIIIITTVTQAGL